MTPRSVRTLRSLDRAVRRGSVEGGQAFLKVSKAFVELEAENVLLRSRLAKQEATAGLEKRAKNAGCLTRFPQGQVFDQRYRALHGDELAARAEREMASNREKTRKAAELEQSMRSKKRKGKEKEIAAAQDEDKLLLW